jgi:tRNA (guanine-N7-)-methyltransferase
MRLRRKQNTDEWLKSQGRLVVLQPESHRGRWKDYFGNDRPIHVELGMGKGKFISELSRMHPEINFIGIDMYDELIRRAGEKAMAMRGAADASEIGNLCLVRWNISRIEQVFAEAEVERIYLNFSDPWPKNRHAHRRLTHPVFVRKYLNMLNERGEIHFKTDSRSLFEFSLNVFADLGLQMRNISLDLHAMGTPPGHIFTEYESKFVEQGLPIYRLEVVVGSEALEAHRRKLIESEKAKNR